MNFLSVENISKAFGNRTLFKNISFGLNEGDKIALIARNGTGKTCLFDMLAGNDTPDTGEIRFRNGVSVGYLAQEPHFLPDETVLQAVFRTRNPALDAIRSYEIALNILDTDPNNTQAQNDLLQASADIDQQNAWDYEQRIKQTLTILQVNDYDKKVSLLSGGQQKRVALAQVLISNPQFLILDEPTNHLDLQMIEWLEEQLSSQNITLLMVTHDRYFLDRVCDQILELETTAGLQTYKGNFSYYISKKAEREAMQAAEQDKLKNLYSR
jgi:ATP-binding cassette subfamily F protein uup